MNEVLTMDEIAARYAPNWVLINEPQTDEHYRVLAGKVLFASPNRDAVYDKAYELRLSNFAFRFLGEWPRDVELVF